MAAQSLPTVPSNGCVLFAALDSNDEVRKTGLFTVMAAVLAENLMIIRPSKSDVYDTTSRENIFQKYFNSCEDTGKSYWGIREGMCEGKEDIWIIWLKCETTMKKESAFTVDWRRKAEGVLPSPLETLNKESFTYYMRCYRIPTIPQSRGESLFFLCFDDDEVKKILPVENCDRSTCGSCR